VEALQPVSTKLVKLTEAFRSLEFTVKEDASSRRRELELLYLSQRLAELRLQLHPILMQVRKLVPSLFPVHGANGWDLARSVDWLVEFPRFLADTFPQLRNFDSSDPTNSGWLQWMAYECFDVDLQSRFHMSDLVRSLPWDPYKLPGHCGDVSPEEFQNPFVVGSFHQEVLAFLMANAPKRARSTYKLNAVTAKTLIKTALKDWGYPNSPFRVKALKTALHRSSLTQLDSDPDTLCAKLIFSKAEVLRIKRDVAESAMESVAKEAVTITDQVSEHKSTVCAVPTGDSGVLLAVSYARPFRIHNDDARCINTVKCVAEQIPEPVKQGEVTNMDQLSGKKSTNDLVSADEECGVSAGEQFP
jgi:hypothetical protein